MLGRLRRAEHEPEVLDGVVAAADRDASLADIDRLNAWFGGYALTMRAVWRAAGGRPASSLPLVVVDVGGGRGDFARRLIHRARRLGRPARVVVVDRDPDLLAVAAESRAAHPELLLVRADATALPFREASADVVTMTLTLHHLEREAAAASLAEMRSVARLAVVVNDLLRTRLTLALVWLATRLFARHWISRVDGPLSVRRAYGADELCVLAEKAGIRGVRLERHAGVGRLIAVF